MEKMINSIDYHVISDGVPLHKISWNKYDCENPKWYALQDLFDDYDFVDLVFIKLTGRSANRAERELFLKTLFMSSMGVGHHPPSVMIPKLVASTTKNKEFAIINGLIGGISSFGTDHLGAISRSMNMISKLKIKCEKISLKKRIKEYVDYKILKNEKIKGFGHPVYRKDSRPEILSKKVRQTYEENLYYDVYSALSDELLRRKGIYPNIDSALALSYLSLGFEPESGVYLSVLSRSISMVSHILEEFPKKPFSFLNQIIKKNEYE